MSNERAEQKNKDFVRIFFSEMFVIVIEQASFFFMVPPFSISSSFGDDNDYDGFALEMPRDMFHRPSVMFSLVYKIKLSIRCLDFRRKVVIDC